MTRNLGSTDLKRLHREWRRKAEGRVALVLDSVATPANVGSILRTAAAMRVDDVWVCGQTAGPEVGATKKVIGEYNMGGAVYTTPVAKDGVIYIATRAELYAVAAK